MCNYLVSCGYGFIGSHLVERLTNDGHDVTVLDDMSNGNIHNLAGLHHSNTYITTRVQYCDDLVFTHKGDKIVFDGIFHLATAPRSASLADPKQDIETNCKGMIDRKSVV